MRVHVRARVCVHIHGEVVGGLAWGGALTYLSEHQILNSRFPHVCLCGDWLVVCCAPHAPSPIFISLLRPPHHLTRRCLWQWSPLCGFSLKQSTPGVWVGEHAEYVRLCLREAFGNEAVSEAVSMRPGGFCPRATGFSRCRLRSSSASFPFISLE